MKNSNYCYPTMWKMKHNEVKYTNDDIQLIKFGVRMLTPAVHCCSSHFKYEFYGEELQKK